MNDKDSALVEWLEEQILDVVLEDWLGLYEVIWTLNDQETDLIGLAKETVATRAIRSLLDQGRVHLVRVTRGHEREEKPVEESLESLVSDPSIWDAPAFGDEYIALIATTTTE